MAEKHEHHHWLIILLIIIVLALLGLVGFFGYQLFYGDTVVRNVKTVEFDDSDLDENVEAKQDAVADLLDSEAEEEDTINVSVYPGDDITPSFSYPSDWNILVSETISSQPGFQKAVYVDPNPIEFLEGTDKPPAIIIINSFDMAIVDIGTHTSYADYMEDMLTNEFVTNLSSTTKILEGGSATLFIGRQEGGLGSDHNFERIVYETSETAVSAYYTDTTPGAEDNDIWEQIKASMDVTSID